MAQHNHSSGATVQGHAHPHASPPDFGKAFAVGIILNTAFVVVEASYGVMSNSMALVADAGHNFSDVLGLVIAWFASILVKRAPNKRYTYGLRGSTILAALFNAVFLLVAVGAIAWEAVIRIGSPEPVAAKSIMIVAAIGIGINALTAWMFASGAKGDINIRGAFLHMAADAAVSAGVVVAGFAILYTGWTWLDPVVSLIIVFIIIWGTWGLLRESLAMSLNAVPAGVDADKVEQYLLTLPQVGAVHDLHIWSMSTTEVALTAHLVTPAGPPGDTFLADLARELEHRFSIHHATIQTETSENACALASPDVV